MTMDPFAKGTLRLGLATALLLAPLLPPATADDDVAPAAMTGLEATADQGKVNLAWDAGVFSVDHYNVYRDGAVVAWSWEARWTDRRPAEGQLHCYRVSAVGTSGLEGPPSDEDCAKALRKVTGWPQYHRDGGGTASTRERADLAGAPRVRAQLSLPGPVGAGVIAGNLDNDRDLELVIATDTRSPAVPLQLRAYDWIPDAVPPLQPKWVVDLPRVSLASHTSGFVSTPALIEVGDPGRGREVFVAYTYQDDAGTSSINEGFLAMYDGDTGAFLDRSSTYFLNRRQSPTIGDVDADPNLEVALLTQAPVGGRGALRVFEVSGGKLVPQFTFTLGSGEHGEGRAAVVDLDGDGMQEIVMGRALRDDDGRVMILDGAGAVLREIPVEVGVTSIAAGDIDGDGIIEIVLTGRTDSGRWSLGVLDTAGGIAGYAVQAVAQAGPQWGTASLGDMDGDRVPDIVLASNNDAMTDLERKGDVRAYRYTGFELVLLGHLPRGGSTDALNRESPGGAALADLDADRALEAVFGSRDGTITSYSLLGGSLVADWTLTRGAPVTAPALIADLDRDRSAEIVIGDESGVVLVLGA